MDAGLFNFFPIFWPHMMTVVIPGSAPVNNFAKYARKRESPKTDSSAELSRLCKKGLVSDACFF